jgi:hypothetical protein
MILDYVDIHSSFQICQCNDRIRIQETDARDVLIENEIPFEEPLLEIPDTALGRPGSRSNQHHGVTVRSHDEIMRVQVLNIPQNIPSFVDPLQMICIIMNFYLAFPTLGDQQTMSVRIPHVAYLLGMLTVLIQNSPCEDIDTHNLPIDGSEEHSPMILIQTQCHDSLLCSPLELPHDYPLLSRPHPQILIGSNVDFKIQRTVSEGYQLVIISQLRVMIHYKLIERQLLQADDPSIKLLFIHKSNTALVQILPFGRWVTFLSPVLLL